MLNHNLIGLEGRPKAEALGYLEANYTANLERKCDAD
jgi:hypothetical protein